MQSDLNPSLKFLRNYGCRVLSNSLAAINYCSYHKSKNPPRSSQIPENKLMQYSLLKYRRTAEKDQLLAGGPRLVKVSKI